MPTSIPAAEGRVASGGLVTVLDDGDGPELCLGGVAESYPPQCGGPRLVGFDWRDHAGQFEQANGVRWGEFAVSGRFDGVSFEVDDVVPAALYDAVAPADDDRFATPCPEPEGGWRVLDAERTTAETMQATFERASGLEGYAGAWMDQSRNPASGGDGGEEQMNDPAYVTVNVRVTGDVKAAEAELREVWGGALCVSLARHTEDELHRIQEELTELPGMLSSGSGDDRVDVQVVHDDGSLQSWADATYGPGLVRISSALVPAG